MVELGIDFILVCFVFLENGWMIFCGYLFVGDVLFNVLGMEYYLLMLMCDLNLVLVLVCQSVGKVGLLCYDIIMCGVQVVCDQVQ